MKDWKDYNIQTNLINTDSGYTQCPKCASKRKNKNSQPLLIDTVENVWFCEHCSWSGSLIYGVKSLYNIKLKEHWSYNKLIDNWKLHSDLNKNSIKHFSDWGISSNTLVKNHITLSQPYLAAFEKITKSLSIPYLKNGKVENIVHYVNGKKYPTLGGAEICYGYDNIDKQHTYLVYDEFEALAFLESGVLNTISLYGGNNLEYKNQEENNIQKMLDFLGNMEEQINSIEKITIAMPNTDYGRHITEELLRRIGREKCWLLTPPEKEQTWINFIQSNGIDKVKQALEHSKPAPVSGIFKIDDVEDEYDSLYENGLQKGYSTGYHTVDEYYTVIPGQLTIITGIPGHGKSNFLDALTVNLAMNHDWRFGIFSPENQPIARHFANIAEKYANAPFALNAKNRMSIEQKEESKIWLNKHFSIILPEEDGNWSMDGILKLAKALVFREGIKGLIIDPWNEIDHSRPNNLNETEYISLMLTKIRNFARNYNVHVWLVAHPAKLYKDKDGRYPVPTLYDISGSAHFRNKADIGITVWRNVGGLDQDIADVHIQKIRFKEVGKIGMASLRYDKSTGRFIDDVDQHKRKESLDRGNEISSDKITRKLVIANDTNDNNELDFLE